MKWIILFLVVVNLAFFAWNYQKAPWLHHAPAAAVDNGDVARLRLLNEPDAHKTRLGAAAKSGAQCPTLGPFEERAHAASAAEQLRGMNIPSHVRVQHLPNKAGYWVVIPPPRSHKTAQKTVEHLRAKGIKDYFLVATGDMKNAISLGVYSSESAAKQRLGDIRHLGFAPEIQGVPLPQRRYWLDLTTKAKPDDAKKALKSLLTHYPHLEHKEHACESP